MPQSNKRTAGLPNPCLVGLQSCCSILLGSPPLGLCQATHGGIPAPQPCWPPASGPTPCWVPHHPLATPLDLRSPGSPPPVRTGPQHGVQSHSSPGYPPPLEPTTLQALLSPSYAWDDRTPTTRTPPPIRPSVWKNWSPAHWDKHQPGVRQPHPPAHQEPHPLGRNWPQLYTLPR
jgi:hypothetical protein